MEQIINGISNLNLEKQHKFIELVQMDLKAIAKAITKYPNQVDISLIEFPPILFENVDINCLNLSIQYLEKYGETELLKMIPYTEVLKASAYLDYYIDCLKNACQN